LATRSPTATKRARSSGHRTRTVFQTGGIPDAIEAGDADPTTPPVDTDRDGVPDVLDLDADGDHVPDRDEDPNGNGVVDPCTTVGVSPCESSRTAGDTDGDGTPDLIERVAGSNPADPASNIPAGDFFFVLPFGGPPQDGRFDFSTNIRRADVFFSVDTTGSFQEEIDQIQGTLESSIIPAVRAAIPDVGFGVGRFEDFPLAPYGLAGDVPFELVQTITEDPSSVAAAVAALSPAAGGLDTPESGVEALYRWATVRTTTAMVSSTRPIPIAPIRTIPGRGPCRRAATAPTTTATSRSTIRSIRAAPRRSTTTRSTGRSPARTRGTTTAGSPNRIPTEARWSPDRPVRAWIPEACPRRAASQGRRAKHVRRHDRRRRARAGPLGRRPRRGRASSLSTAKRVILASLASLELARGPCETRRA
jgi:hypothetical protein